MLWLRLKPSRYCSPGHPVLSLFLTPASFAESRPLWKHLPLGSILVGFGATEVVFGRAEVLLRLLGGAAAPPYQ